MVACAMQTRRMATMAEPVMCAVAVLLESVFDSRHRLHRHQRRRGGLPVRRAAPRALLAEHAFHRYAGLDSSVVDARRDQLRARGRADVPDAAPGERGVSA